MAGRLPLKQIVSSLHPLKQKSPIDSTDEGMVTEVKLPQSLKKYLFNEITDEGIVIEVKLLQPQKQPSAREVTEKGSVIDVKLLQ